jgi:hypothetical protein
MWLWARVDVVVFLKKLTRDETLIIACGITSLHDCPQGDAGTTVRYRADWESASMNYPAPVTNVAFAEPATNALARVCYEFSLDGSRKAR